MRHMSCIVRRVFVTRFKAPSAAGIVASLQSVAAQCMLRGCMHLHGLPATIVDDPNQGKAAAYLFNFISVLCISFEYLKDCAAPPSFIQQAVPVPSLHSLPPIPRHLHLAKHISLAGASTVSAWEYPWGHSKPTPIWVPGYGTPTPTPIYPTPVYPTPTPTPSGGAGYPGPGNGDTPKPIHKVCVKGLCFAEPPKHCKAGYVSDFLVLQSLNNIILTSDRLLVC
jgi:hypothetical protein